MNQKFNRIRLILVAFVLLATVESFTSCTKYSFLPPVIDPDQALYLTTDIQPIFNAKCVSCHAGTKPPDLREGKSYNALTKGEFVTLPGETSVLYTTMTSSDHGPRSSDSDKQKVLNWINQGALNN